jgi:hypothetical protein
MPKRFNKVVLAAFIVAVTGVGHISAFPGEATPLASALPLGTITRSSSKPTDCPAGTTCQGFIVTCPGVSQSRTAHLSIAEPTGPRRGLVVGFAGGGGKGYLFFGAETQLKAADLQNDGFKVVAVSWAEDWLHSAVGEDAGVAQLACRPATIIKWIHDNLYKPMGITVDKVGKCGFCVTGNSGGSTQTAYAIGYYGLDTILNAVIPTAGPPHASMTKACLRTEPGYQYTTNSFTHVDGAYGFPGGGGPCEQMDESFIPRWDADSIAVGAPDYAHPTTRIHLMVGDQDSPTIINMNEDYYDRLVAAGTPLVKRDVLQGVPHQVHRALIGAAAIRASLNEGGEPPPSDDTQRPTVTLTAPANGATLSGTATMAATATDNVGVTRVDFLVDGQVKGIDRSTPYNATLDTTTLSNGAHILTAKAYDAAGNRRASAAVNVTVKNRR